MLKFLRNNMVSIKTISMLSYWFVDVLVLSFNFNFNA